MDVDKLITVVADYKTFYAERPAVRREDVAAPNELTRRECDDLVHLLDEVLKYLKSQRNLDG